MREWRARNRETLRAYERDYRKQNPARVRTNSAVRKQLITATKDAAFAAYKLVRARKFKDALAAYDDLDKSNRPDLWVNRGVTLQALYRLPEAIESFNRALEISPDDIGAIVNRGAVLGWLGRYEDALVDYDRAVELDPDYEPARLGRSVILGSLGEYNAALGDSEHVLELDYGNGGAHYNLSLLLLSMGEYREGFRQHEWRYGTNAVLGRHRFDKPVWAGEKTKKRILVHCEQGLGDSLQFMRYLPMMAGLNVTVEAPKALVRLFEQYDFPVVMRDDPLPEFDLHVPLMSLGAIFGTGLETIPATGGYLKAKPSLDWTAGIRKRLKVGVAWYSGVRIEQPIAVAMQRRKSIPDITPLLDIPGITYVSLQKDKPDNGIPLQLLNPMIAVRDLQDTADVIASLDLVITVDSAVAHLAGALGKPVWVLNRYDICWRWLSGDVQSPWYDSAKIYRQSRPMHWDDVLRDVRRDLERLTKALRDK